MLAIIAEYFEIFFVLKREIDKGKEDKEREGKTEEKKEACKGRSTSNELTSTRGNNLNCP